MPYGAFGKPANGYTETVSLGELMLGTSWYERDVHRKVFYTSPNPHTVRVGQNSTDYNKPTDLNDFINFEIQSYRKVVGTVDRRRRVTYWEIDAEDPSISVRRTKYVPYKKKVWGVGVRFRRVKSKNKVPSPNLLKPNALTFVTQEKSCDRSTINLRYSSLLYPGGPLRTRFHLRFKTLPGEAVARDENGYYRQGIAGLPSEPDWFGSIHSNPIPPDLDRDALERLYKKVADEFPNYLVDVVQVRSTWKTITKIAKTAIEVVWSMARLDLKRLAGTLPDVKAETIANLWLEFIYGVKPVLDDIDASIDLYLRDVRRWRSYSASKKHEATSNLSFTFYGHDDPYTPYAPVSLPAFHVDETRKSTHIVRYGVVMAGDESFARKVRKDNSFASALSVAYETIPYSFCLDWIYNLGGYLYSRDVMNERKLYQWKSLLVIEEITRTFTPIPYSNPSYSLQADPFTVKLKRVSFVRDPRVELGSMPLPKVRDFTEIVSWRRSLNALALFTQLVSRRKSGS